MDSTSIVIIILLMNTVIALFYFLIGLLRRDKQLFINGAVILVCPVVGFLVYVVSELFYKILFPSFDMDKSDITFSKEVKTRIQKMDFAEETMVIPMEESLLASNESERRSALLNKLKKGSGRDTSLIVKAVQNNDAETAHYAASAVTSMNAGFLSRLKQFEFDYQQEPDKYEIVRGYADCRLEYIGSGILNNIERNTSLQLYLNLMKVIYTKFRDQVTADDYKVMVSMYLELLLGEEALYYSDACFIQYPDSEIAYMNKIKVYYTLGMKEEFFDMLDQLKRSSLFLSKEALDLIRTFS